VEDGFWLVANGRAGDPGHRAAVRERYLLGDSGRAWELWPGFKLGSQLIH